MKTKLLATLAGAGMLAASSAAWSQEPRFYLGGAVGQATMKDACQDLPSGFSCDDKDTAFKLFGGYQINRNFAVEAAYNDFGKAKANGTISGVSVDATAEATAWELTAIGSWPIANRFAVYGKLGVYYGDLKSNATATSGGATGTGSAKDTNTDLTFGLGASFDLTRNVSLRAEWQRFNDMGGNDTGKSDVDMLSIGALYRF